MKQSIPICFCIDYRMVMQLGVTITSLVLNANGAIYDIIVVIDETVSETDKERILSIGDFFEVSINLITVTNQFSSQIIHNSNWSKACYYRLLLPDLLADYDTVLYSDVDIIYQSSLLESYNPPPYDDYYVVACQDNMNSDTIQKQSKALGLTPEEIYFCAGLMIINLKKFRELELVEQSLKLVEQNFVCMDQDVLNCLCKGHVKYFSPFVCRFAPYILPINPLEKEVLLTTEDITRSLNEAAIHYIGSSKPWNSFCHRWEVWWHYYTLSPFFDYNYYWQSQHDLANGDYLTFWRRLKLLIRYFIGKDSAIRRWLR